MSDLDLDQPWLEALHWDAEGLIPVVAQDAETQAVLMFAWMNRQALEETLRTGEAVYWSRSRARLWRKGEISGHTQQVRAVRTDCDGDVLLLSIVQRGGIACHTGRQSCFFHLLQDAHWVTDAPVLKPPQEIYGK